ncbi:MAG TPA: BNR-4 repeat-containing protein [Pirellulales bacterium]|jgi:hypothetical protein
MTVDYFAANGSTYPNYDNIGPCAFFDLTDNKTWDCHEIWNGSHRAIAVTVFDHATGAIDEYVISTNTLTNDGHGEGALCMTPDGRVLLFWGCHLSPCHIAITTNPRDPTDWTILTDLTTDGGVSYPHPVLVGSAIWLQLRDTFSGTHKPCVMFHTTTLSGTTVDWSSPIAVADFGNSTWFYASLMYAKGTDLHWVATQANADNSIRKNVYYFIYDTTDGSLKNWDKSFSIAAGSLPALITDLDGHYKIFDQPTSGGSTAIPMFIFDDAGKSHVLTCDGLHDSGDFDMWHLTNESGSWVSEIIGATNNEVNDFCLVPASGGRITAYFPTVAPAAFAVDGDMYFTTRELDGSWSDVELFRASDGSNAIGVGLPVFNGSSALRYVVSEIKQDDMDTSAGGLRKFAYGDFGYVTARSAPVAVNAAYNRKITITSHPASTLMNFPVLVSVTDAALKTVANGGHVQNSNGYDIVFAADNAYVTPYAWEVVSYDGSSGTLEAWVQIPSVSSSVDTAFYMLYGDAAISTFQSTATDVWDSHYKGVYHLSAGLNVNDSTAGANNGTNNGATAAAAKIGSGAAFDGSSQYIDLSNNANLKIALPATLSFWIKKDASYNASTNYSFLNNDIVFGGAGGAGRFGIDIEDGGSGTIFVAFGDGTGGGTYRAKEGATALSNATDYFITCVVRGATDMTIYLNGADDGGSYSGTGGTLAYGSGSGSIGLVQGSTNGGSNGGFFFGKMDEVRISDIERAAAWVAAEYANQNSPGTFYTVGSEAGQSVRKIKRPGMGLRLGLRAA